MGQQPTFVTCPLFSGFFYVLAFFRRKYGRRPTQCGDTRGKIEKLKYGQYPKFLLFNFSNFPGRFSQNVPSSGTLFSRRIGFLKVFLVCEKGSGEWYNGMSTVSDRAANGGKFWGAAGGGCVLGVCVLGSPNIGNRRRRSEKFRISCARPYSVV